MNICRTETPPLFHSNHHNSRCWLLDPRGSCKTAAGQKIDDFDASSQGQQAGPCCTDETARRELSPKGRFYGVHEFCNCLERGKHKKGLVGEEIPKQLIEQGLAGESKICGKVLQWFASLYGATAGNVALQFLSVGGIYLAGGIAPRILSILEQGEFMKAFTDKGRFQELLQKIPVHVVLNESLPLLGALELCLR